MTMQTEPHKENPYEALRAAKIARNEAKLRELGLIASRSSDVFKLKRGQMAKEVAQQSKLPVKRIIRPIGQEEVKQLRRSPRTRKVTETVYTQSISQYRLKRTSTFPTDDGKPAPQNNHIQNIEIKNDIEDQTKISKPLEVKTTPPKTSSYPPNSARSIVLDLQLLLFGRSGEQPGILGETMSRTSKASVMEDSAIQAGLNYKGGLISFNKYSGVQEWGNDVLFLWVNLFAPQGEVVNEFLLDGRQVTWFGGSKMHDGTSVIQKLKRVGSQAHSADNSSGVVLWCRPYLHEIRSFGPYVCFGRLHLETYNPDASPLAFVWNLVDFDQLFATHDVQRLELLERMIRNK